MLADTLRVLGRILFLPIILLAVVIGFSITFISGSDLGSWDESGYHSDAIY